MGVNSTTDLFEDWASGILIGFACFFVGIGGAWLLEGQPWGMFVGFILGVLVTVIGVSLFICRSESWPRSFQQGNRSLKCSP
jgi:F0F1-type ATP synthase assembly protein I